MRPSSQPARTPSRLSDSVHHQLTMYALVAAFIVAFGFLTVADPLFAASKEKVLYSFNGGDGAFPDAGLILDVYGNLYGTTAGGGVSNPRCDKANFLGCGTVFQLTPGANETWTETVLHSFTGPPDGSEPSASLVLDAHGNLYGTTVAGGASGSGCYGYGCGVVFRLSPTANGKWAEEVLHSFDGRDGSAPSADLILDADGNLYGTTSQGGVYGSGTVFELTPSARGGWKETVLHNFDGKDGANPLAGLIFDAAGNLYGTTYVGGAYYFGTAFQLKRGDKNRWTENVLASFNTGSIGYYPSAALVFDKAGNLYGTTAGNSGSAFELNPGANGEWTEMVVHLFCSAYFCTDGGNSTAALIFDAAGNLYGTASTGGNTGSLCGNEYGCGTAFRLTLGSNGEWTETVLHAFNYDGEDGTIPEAGLYRDSAGNLYGTTVRGGASGSGCGGYGCGTVFEITP